MNWMHSFTHSLSLLNMTNPESLHNTSAIDRLLQHKPESLSELVAGITHDIYVELRSAIELGKFNDGARLSQGQLDNCIQLMILYEQQQLPQNQRTGFNLPDNCKSQSFLKSSGAEVATLVRNEQDL